MASIFYLRTLLFLCWQVFVTFPSHLQQPWPSPALSLSLSLSLNWSHNKPLVKYPTNQAVGVSGVKHWLAAVCRHNGWSASSAVSVRTSGHAGYGTPNLSLMTRYISAKRDCAKTAAWLIFHFPYTRRQCMVLWGLESRQYQEVSAHVHIHTLDLLFPNSNNINQIAEHIFLKVFPLN